MDTPLDDSFIAERHNISETTDELTPDLDFTHTMEAFLAHIQDLPQGTPLTYGATPLDRVNTLQQQLQLAEELRQLTLTNIPEGIPKPLVQYMQPMFSKRFHSRGEANEDNYLSALLRKEDYADSPEVIAMIERGEQGLASPAELLTIRSLLGIKSVELGCVSHPYGNRIENIYDMRQAIKDHVEALDGLYDSEPDVRYRVKSIICPNHENTLQSAVGLLMTKKTTLGMMPDGTIIRERASFVLRTDLPEVRQHLAEMRAVVDAPTASWQSDLVEAGHLQGIIDMLMENDEFTKLIPISSTVYAYNLETEEAVTKKKQAEAEERRRTNEELMPEFSRHLRELYGEDWFKVPEPDVTDGMFYDGPPLR